MGLWDNGGDDNTNGAQQRANQLVEEQINQGKAELEQKRQALTDQRIAIVKGQGGEEWSPNRASSVAGKQPTKGELDDFSQSIQPWFASFTH